MFLMVSLTLESDMTEKRHFWKTFKKNRTAVIGLILGTAVINIAIFAPFLTASDPLEQDLASRLHPPNGDHLFGTDTYGRDVLARILYGARVSLLIGFGSVAMGISIGSLWGMIGGITGGMLGNILMRGVDILMSFPTLIMGLIVMVLLGQGLPNLILAIGIVMFPRFARIGYGSTTSLINSDFIIAAKAIGISNFRLLIKHILPNISGNLLVMGTMWLATSIRIEASLSFLGLGIAPPTPTWGNMIRTGVRHLDSSWLTIYPGLFILITTLAFNMLGDGIRDISDPKLR